MVLKKLVKIGAYVPLIYLNGCRMANEGELQSWKKSIKFVVYLL